MQMKEVYLDNLGRAVSPSMATQYSPPSTEADRVWRIPLPPPSLTTQPDADHWIPLRRSRMDGIQPAVSSPLALPTTTPFID